MIDAVLIQFVLLPILIQSASLDIIAGIAGIIVAGILLVIGILIIILLVGLAIILLPAIIVAVIVWFLTGSFVYAGIAFLVVALISMIARLF